MLPLHTRIPRRSSSTLSSKTSSLRLGYHQMLYTKCIKVRISFLPLFERENPSQKPLCHLQSDLYKLQLHPGEKLDMMGAKFLQYINDHLRWESLVGSYVFTIRLTRVGQHEDDFTLQMEPRGPCQFSNQDIIRGETTRIQSTVDPRFLRLRRSKLETPIQISSNSHKGRDCGQGEDCRYSAKVP